jgi:hypothetical protein
MSKATISPFGFCFGQPKAGKELLVLAVPEVEALYCEYLDARTTHVSMDFIKSMVKVSKLLLGDNPILHLSSIYERRTLCIESDYNYDFLRDTVSFIETGNRPMGISTRSQLMDFHREDETPLFHPLKSLPLNKVERIKQTLPPGESVYTHWLSQTNGVHDMLCTLIVLFGKHTQLCCNK